MNRVTTFADVLTLQEAAAYLRLSKETLKQLATQGRLPGRRIERTWRFLKAALDDWLRGKEDGRNILLQQFGAFADDETLPELLKNIYAERGRPEVEEG